jgi:hypothetical protein
LGGVLEPLLSSSTTYITTATATTPSAAALQGEGAGTLKDDGNSNTSQTIATVAATVLLLLGGAIVFLVTRKTMPAEHDAPQPNGRDHDHDANDDSQYLSPVPLEEVYASGNRARRLAASLGEEDEAENSVGTSTGNATTEEDDIVFPTSSSRGRLSDLDENAASTHGTEALHGTEACALPTMRKVSMHLRRTLSSMVHHHRSDSSSTEDEPLPPSPTNGLIISPTRPTRSSKLWRFSFQAGAVQTPIRKVDCDPNHRASSYSVPLAVTADVDTLGNSSSSLM